MHLETLTDRADLVIRRLVLEPGEATPWHSDACRRFTVVVSGASLAIEYRDDGGRHTAAVPTGAAGWDDPEPRVHRAINLGPGSYHEVVSFFRGDGPRELQPGWS